MRCLIFLNGFLVACLLCYSANAQDLSELRTRAQSDDAATAAEAMMHGIARGLVISHVEPNELRVGGREFRVKRNPHGDGAIVYDPRTRFNGVERNLVWWVPNDVTACAMNSPSKDVTPLLQWPREACPDAPPTSDVVAYVFENESLPDPESGAGDSETVDTYTVKEYKIYQALIDTPMSISEDEAARRIGRQFEITPSEVDSIAERVNQILIRNDWFSSPEFEIRHATDWTGNE